jgi:hypothetical protein
MQTKFYDKDEKAFAKAMVLTALQSGITFYSFEDYGVTVALKRESPEMCKFAVAIASSGEIKFRKLMGKIVALERFEQGAMPAIVPKGVENDFALRLAELVG